MRLQILHRSVEELVSQRTLNLGLHVDDEARESEETLVPFVPPVISWADPSHRSDHDLDEARGNVVVVNSSVNLPRSTTHEYGTWYEYS